MHVPRSCGAAGGQCKTIGTMAPRGFDDLRRQTSDADHYVKQLQHTHFYGLPMADALWIFLPILAECRIVLHNSLNLFIIPR